MLRSCLAHPSCRLASLLLALATGACQRPAATSTSATATTAACIDSAKVNPSAICTAIYDPVCGCDDKTYPNACRAEAAGVRTYTKGPCPGK